MAICQEYDILPQNWLLAHVSALGPYSLLPFRHMTTSLPQKDSCLNRLCLLWVLDSITLLSLSQPIARLSQCLLPSRLSFKSKHTHFTVFTLLRTRFAYITTLTFHTDATAIRLASHKQPDYRSLKFFFPHIQITLSKTESLSSSLSIPTSPSRSC